MQAWATVQLGGMAVLSLCVSLRQIQVFFRPTP